MSGRLGNDVSQSAVDAAAALLTDAPAPEPVAPGEPQAQPEEQPQPVREGRRDARGRFVPAGEATPTPAPVDAQPDPQPAPEQPQPSELEQLRAEHARQQQELERLRNTYRENTESQRRLLQQAREEAEQLRRAQQQARVDQLAQWRKEVEALPDRDARGLPNEQKIQAERELLAIERAEFERNRQAAEEQAAEEQRQRQQQVAYHVNERMKHGVWEVVERYHLDESGNARYGLPKEEFDEVVRSLQTPDLGHLMNTLNGPQVVDYFRDVVGPRFDAALRERAQTRAERNRQAAVAEGAHQHISGMPPAAAPPAYLKFTRRGGARGGVDSVANAILNGALDEE